MKCKWVLSLERSLNNGSRSEWDQIGVRPLEGGLSFQKELVLS